MNGSGPCSATLSRVWWRAQVANCLETAGDFDRAVDYSMRQEAKRVVDNGRRIAQCMLRCTASSLLPVKPLRTLSASLGMCSAYVRHGVTTLRAC